MTNPKKTQANNGFTLLEILITVIIVSIVGTLISQVFFTTTRTNKKTELLKDVKQNGDYALEIISRMIRNAERITDVCDPLGTIQNMVTIESLDGQTTTFGCRFDDEAGASRIASISGYSDEVYYLTSENVTLGGISCEDDDMTLTFSCYEVIDAPTKVSIRFSLGQNGLGLDQFETASIDFHTSVSPRN